MPGRRPKHPRSQRTMTIQIVDSRDYKSRTITAYNPMITLDDFTLDIERHLGTRYRVTSVSDRRHQRR